MSVRLFILGIVKKQDCHGYEIKKQLSDLGVENWSDLNWSSVYHALRQMEREGLLEKKKINDNGNRPAKDVYSIRKEGVEEFIRLLKDTCATISVDKNPLYIALMYLHELPDVEKVMLLRKRHATLKELQELVEQKKTGVLSAPVPKEQRDLIAFALDRDLSQRKADMEWTENLIEYYQKALCCTGRAEEIHT